jgi:TetR/AcrR family tetracycline transcriptional repressor
VPTTSTSATPGLTPEAVVEVAHRLISDHGLEWFSMRKLAAELGVNPMTVYLRFANKDELLEAVARRGLRDLRLPAPPDGSWEDRALALAHALRAHLLADRNLLALYAGSRRHALSVLDATEQGLALMEEAGYREDEAVAAFRVLFWHTVGSALLHHDADDFPANREGGLPGTIDPATHPSFARLLPHFGTVDADALFIHTTRLLVAGLAAGPDGEPTAPGRTAP